MYTIAELHARANECRRLANEASARADSWLRFSKDNKNPAGTRRVALRRYRQWLADIRKYHANADYYRGLADAAKARGDD